MNDKVLAKKGRPRGPETGVLYKRVPAVEKKVLSDLVDAAMDRALDKWSKENGEYLKGGGWCFGQSGAVPLDSKPFVGPDHTKVLEAENRVLKNEIKALSEKLSKAERKVKEYENYST